MGAAEASLMDQDGIFSQSYIFQLLILGKVFGQLGGLDLTPLSTGPKAGVHSGGGHTDSINPSIIYLT